MTMNQSVRSFHLLQVPNSKPEGTAFSKHKMLITVQAIAPLVVVARIIFNMKISLVNQNESKL